MKLDEAEIEWVGFEILSKEASRLEEMEQTSAGDHA
ncbi:hypothetical protein DO72_401 [Burkholderia pseudomallei]|nr:hypothetical protein DO72_401 [Burkholderia pseudomallei]